MGDGSTWISVKLMDSTLRTRFFEKELEVVKRMR